MECYLDVKIFEIGCLIILEGGSYSIGEDVLDFRVGEAFVGEMLPEGGWEQGDGVEFLRILGKVHEKL